MTFWRVFSKARSTRVALEGTFAGSTAFLVGGSPKLLELPLRLMNMPGVWSMAINNAAIIFEPQAFVCTDHVACFNNNIFANPRIIKFIPISNSHQTADGKRVCRYPNTFFYDSDDKTFIPAYDFCKLEGPLPAYGSTFYTALALLYQLGFKKVYLIGCTFSADGYAHGIDPGDEHRKKSIDRHNEIVEGLKVLLPAIEDEGMEVRTCHFGSDLIGVCKYKPFTDAISEAVSVATAIEFNTLKLREDLEG